MTEETKEIKSVDTKEETKKKTIVKIPSQVAQHVSYFTKDGETFDHQSITDAHTKQYISSGVAIKGKAIMNMVSDRKEEPTVTVLCKYANQARTGFWDEKGNFDQVRFDEFLKFVKDKVGIRTDGLGRQVITLADITAILKELHTGKNHGNATWVGYVIPVSWKAVTAGSVGELIMYYSDSWITIDKKNVQAMTLNHLKLWYTDNLRVLKMREDKLLPVSLAKFQGEALGL